MENNEINILTFAFTFILIGLGVFILLFYFLFKQKQKANRKKIAALNEQLLKTEIEIQEQTLKNLGEEIHDNIGQVLSLAKLNLGTFNTFTDEANQEKLISTRELVSKAISDLRDLAKSMHGEKIAEIGLQNAIEHELKILRNSGQFNTELLISGDVYQLPSQTQTVLFRIVQEALHNEIKHSKAKNISIAFEYTPHACTLSLKDDGIGFSPEKLKDAETGIGLKSMKNRASLIGAEFSISSIENKGINIKIKVPIGNSL